MNTSLEDILNLLTQTRIPDLIQDIFHKTVNKHLTCLYPIDTARLQIKHLLIIQLADRRPVRALHVIREDLQLRFCIRMRVRAQQEVLVELIRIAQLRLTPDNDLAVEDGMRLVPQNTFIKLIAHGRRRHMIDKGYAFRLSPSCQMVQTVQKNAGPLPLKNDVDMIMHRMSAPCHKK